MSLRSEFYWFSWLDLPFQTQTGDSTELTLSRRPSTRSFYVRDTDEDIGEMVKILSTYFEEHDPRITEMLRFAPPEKTTVFIYTDKDQFREMIGRDTEGTYDATDQRIKVYTPSDLSQPDVRKEYTFQLVHEFVHAVIQQMNPIIGYIKWLDEGTAYASQTSCRTK